MKKIVVKSGVAQLPLFTNENYPYYEAHLKGNENLYDLLKTPMKLLSLHMPSQVKTSAGFFPVDFCDEGEIGTASFQKLQELVTFSREQDVAHIILHLGFFDSFQQNRWALLKRTAEKLRSLDAGKVKLCIENVPCWSTLAFEHEPIISTEEHFLFFQQHFPQAGLVLDTDHLAISIVFDHFYRQFREKYGAFSAPTENAQLKREIEMTISQATRKEPEKFKILIHDALKKFLSSVKPTIVHAVGSDYCNYLLIDTLPVVGEALPLNFTGKIKGCLVQDRIDHLVWTSLLPEDVFITLELHLRPEYDYLAEIRKDYGFLKRIL